MKNIEFHSIELTQKLFGFHNTQTDLPTGKKSGLIESQKILTQIKGIEFVTFSKEDVVRHPLVSDIIDAYEKNKNWQPVKTNQGLPVIQSAPVMVHAHFNYGGIHCFTDTGSE